MSATRSPLRTPRACKPAAHRLTWSSSWPYDISMPKYTRALRRGYFLAVSSSIFGNVLSGYFKRIGGPLPSMPGRALLILDRAGDNKVLLIFRTESDCMDTFFFSHPFSFTQKELLNFPRAGLGQ